MTQQGMIPIKRVQTMKFSWAKAQKFEHKTWNSVNNDGNANDDVCFFEPTGFTSPATEQTQT